MHLGGEGERHSEHCLAQEENKMSLARAQTWTARPGGSCIEHEISVPPQIPYGTKYHVTFFLFYTQ